MKLQNEYNNVLQAFRDKFTRDQILQHIEAIKDDCKDITTRVSMDMLRAAVGVSAMCEWYEKYDCHDSHMVTLAKKAYREFMGVV